MDPASIMVLASSLGPLIAQAALVWGDKLLDSAAEEVADATFNSARALVQRVRIGARDGADEQLERDLVAVIKGPEKDLNVENLSAALQAHLPTDPHLAEAARVMAQQLAAKVNSDDAMRGRFSNSNIEKLIHIETQVNYGPVTF